MTPTPDAPDSGSLGLPPLVRQLMATGRWLDPGTHGWSLVVPWLRAPDDEVELLLTEEAMRRESAGFKGLAGPRWRTSTATNNPERCDDSTWLDAGRALLIAVNKVPGSDLGVALDLRTNPEDPRVLASVYVEAHDTTEDEQCSLRGDEIHIWREVAPTFTRFAEAVGLIDATGRVRNQ